MVCFFYYSCLLPFIWLGKKVYWTFLKDTAEQKQRAEQAVLKAAMKKGKSEKYGVIDLEAEMRKLEQASTGEGMESKRQAPPPEAHSNSSAGGDRSAETEELISEGETAMISAPAHKTEQAPPQATRAGKKTRTVPSRAQKREKWTPKAHRGTRTKRAS